MTDIFNFEKNVKLNNWYVINDGVMGGLSRGKLKINADGHGQFSGFVSLENNGGFTSIQCNMDPLDVSKFKTIHLKVKGDEKRYQARIKHKSSDYYSYAQYFDTSSEWQTISLPLNQFRPTFRGRSLPMPDFNHDEIGQFTILIGNKKEENFNLLIDRVYID